MILTAYTPFAGIILCRLLMAILAVGKPIFLPIWYPEMTYPCSAYGWFNNRAASDTFPSLINLRITEELTFLPVEHLFPIFSHILHSHRIPRSYCDRNGDHIQ